MSLPILRDLLAHHFSHEELRGLCFDLGLEYEDLPGETRPGRAQSLIEYCLRRGRLPDLHRRCTELRPQVAWPELPSLAGELDKVQGAMAVQEGLQGILPADQVAAMLISLRQKELDLLARLVDNPAGVQASLHGSGAIAQGEGAIAVGERGVHVGGDVGGDVITGDKVQHILNLYQNAPGRPLLDTAAFTQALGRYLGWVERNYGRLNLRGLQQQERQNPSLTLADVYISLQAQMTTDWRRQGQRGWAGERPDTLDMRELLSLGNRLVIIGGPGSGKTTYLRLIATALARALRTGDPAGVRQHLGLKGDLPLPIIVALSEFNSYRRQYEQPDDPRQGTLTAFLSYSLIRQHNIDLPDDFFERLLRQGQGCALLLDGLDEVAEERERWLVRQAVEELADNSGIPHIIVTSRARAYQGRAILPAPFRLAEAQPMTPAQVNALLQRWCYAVYDPAVAAVETADLQQAIANLEALRKQRGDARLIDTPLLVTIVAIVHYDQRRLPEQRAELYEKCVEVLLAERHKPDRSVYYDLADWGGTLAEKRDWLAHLAYQMMSVGEKAGRTVAESQLLAWLGPVLESRFGPDEATKRLADFVQAMRTRGSLLTERGGEYQFTHLTFQEYLSAYYLAETVRDVKEIIALLLAEGRVADSWWREVVLLVSGHLGSKSATPALGFCRGLVTHTGEDELGLAAAELAATAFLELDSQDEAVAGAVRTCLARRLTDPDLRAPAGLRALGGRTLARLGDPRPGVGTILHSGQKLPDIVWGGEVPAGTYTIGGDKSQYADEKPRPVVIKQPYRLARYPVTYAQFQCFVDAPDFDDERWWAGMPGDAQGLDEQAFPFTNHPRERVSWYQAMAFGRWLTARLHAGELPAGVLTGDVRQYRITLPHEYEWEVAARWPNSDVVRRLYPWGPEFDAAKANTGEGERVGQTTAVGIYPAGRNAALELYDLSGNVWEWCRNKYNTPDVEVVDSSGDWRVLRGGSWRRNAGRARAAYRDYFTPAYRNDYGGFRLVVVGGGGASSPIS